MSFTDQKPFMVTEKDTKLRWGGGKNGKYFRCYLCGHKFVAGDVARWQYTNDTKGAGGNPMVCQPCDGTRDEIIAKWSAMHAEARELKANRLWWFLYDREGESQ